MAMVQVGKMRVAMHEPGMPVPMRVRLAFRRLSPVAMPMMFIVQMRVLMLDRLVSMLVPVPLGQVEPDAESHKAAGGQQLQARLLAEHGDRQQGADKWGDREVCAGACGPEVPQRQDEQDKAGAVAEEADQHAAQERAGCRE